MDLALSRSEAQLQAKARRFCDEVLLPLEPVVTEHGHLPLEKRVPLRQAVVDWGFTGINHRTDDGGCGFTILEQMLINEQLGRASCGLWAAVWQPPIALRYGAPAQKAAISAPAAEVSGVAAMRSPSQAPDPIRV